MLSYSPQTKRPGRIGGAATVGSGIGGGCSGRVCKKQYTTQWEQEKTCESCFHGNLVLHLLLVLSIGCAGPRSTGGPISGGTLKDGIYDGEATEGPVKVLAKVTIENQRITDIELVSHRTWKGKAVEKAIPDRIIEHQSTSVDSVSGATRSSIAIMNAVEDALQKAK